MLTIFPSLLTYQELSPLLIRITLAIILIHWAYKGIKNHKIFTQPRCIAMVEGLVGVLILIGLWTQVGALVVVIDMVVKLAMKVMSKTFMNDGVNYYLLILVLALSLLVTGAGLLARDLPL